MGYREKQRELPEAWQDSRQNMRLSWKDEGSCPPRVVWHRHRTWHTNRPPCMKRQHRNSCHPGMPTASLPQHVQTWPWTPGHLLFHGRWTSAGCWPGQRAQRPEPWSSKLGRGHSCSWVTSYGQATNPALTQIKPDHRESRGAGFIAPPAHLNPPIRSVASRWFRYLTGPRGVQAGHPCPVLAFPHPEREIIQEFCHHGLEAVHTMPYSDVFQRCKMLKKVNLSLYIGATQIAWVIDLVAGRPCPA